MYVELHCHSAFSFLNGASQPDELVMAAQSLGYPTLALTDINGLWNRDVEHLHYEQDRVNRVGTKHRCVVGGNLIEFETITGDFGGDRLVYGERIIESPLVDDVASYYILESEGQATRVRLEVHYKPRPFPRSLLAPVFRFGFGRRLPGVLRSVKEVAERRPEPTGAGAAANPAAV